MGRYIDWTDLTGRYPDAAKAAAGAESVNSHWLPGVEAEVDARLSKRYAVPFTPAPPLVRDVCVDLLYCRMTARQETTQVIYDRVMGLLTEVADGTVPLLTGSGTVLAPAGRGVAWTSNSYRSAFGPDDPVNWSRSIDEQLAAQSERHND